MSRLAGPLRWIGGKHYLAPWHVSRFPDYYDLLLIPFAGGMSEIFHAKRGNIIANDIDGEVCNFWEVLRDRTEEFVTRCTLTPLSRELVDNLSSEPVPQDPVVRAWMFFMLNRQSFSGFQSTRNRDVMGCADDKGSKNGKASWSISPRIRRGINESVSALLSSVDRLWEVAEVLRTVALEHGRDFEEFIEKYAVGPEVMIYCDPPYFLGEGDNVYYSTVFTKNDHVRLSKVLSLNSARALVCGHDSLFYRELYRGWRMETKDTTLNASTGEVKGSRTEAIWMNY